MKYTKRILSVAIALLLLFSTSNIVIAESYNPPTHILIMGDGSGGGGGGGANGGGGGNGGGDADVIDMSATSYNCVIFGDGSGGGAGGRGVGTADARGGLGGGGDDVIMGGAGNDIIFGDGFDGTDSLPNNNGFYPGHGGLGGGGGGGAGGGFGTPPGGGVAGLGGGGGGGGTVGGPGGATWIVGIGNAGANANGSVSGGVGGNSAVDQLESIGFGGALSSKGGGGGGGFGGAAGGEGSALSAGSFDDSGMDGEDGDTQVHFLYDYDNMIYSLLTESFLRDTVPAVYCNYGAGNDTIDGGGGNNELFGLGGNDTFIVDSADHATRNRIWDFQGGDMLKLETNGVVVATQTIDDVVNNGVVGDYDNDGVSDDVRITFSGIPIDFINVTELVSENGTVSIPNQTPQLSLSETPLIYTTYGSYSYIDAAAVLNDPDGDDQWNGGALSVQISDGARNDDQLSISGADITIVGTILRYGGVNIGTLSVSDGIVTGSTILTIAFDSTATNDIVQKVLRAVRFKATAGGTSNREITVSAMDLSGAQATDTRSIQVTGVDAIVENLTLQSDGSTIAIDCNAYMMSDPSSAVSDFTVKVDGEVVSVASLTNNNNDDILELTLTNPVTAVQEVTVTYLGTSVKTATNDNLTPFTDMIATNNAPPSDGSVTINSGDGYTNSTSVTLTLASEGATQMMISENSNFSGASFETFATSKSFTISSGDGTKTVYVKYANEAGSESTPVSDTIILDTQKPSTTITSTESNPTNADPIPITITFNESVTGFELNNLTIGNGTAGNFNGSGTTYTADITPTTDGTVTVNVNQDVAFDAAANGNAAATQFSIVYDTTPPTGSIVLNDGDEYTTDNRVGIRISAEGATGYMYSEDPTFAGESYTVYSTAVTTTYNFSSSDGVKTLYVKFRDAAGNETTTTISDSIILDTTSPTDPSVSISGGSYTNSTTLNLSLSATDADYMIISESSSFTGASYEPYDTSKTFTVSGGDGMKYVYVRFKDGAGNVSDLAYDYVMLDTTPPTDGSILINDGDAVTNQQTVDLSLSASGAVSMMISESSTFEGASYESYAISKSFTLSSGDGTKTIYVKYKDMLGNETTETISDSIVLDTAAPTSGSVSINSGATHTNNTSVTLTLSATGASEMMISEDADFTGASYESYATSKSFTLSSGDGIKTVYVRYKDEAGNETTVTISDSITLDMTSPTVVITSTEDDPTNASPIPIPITITFSESVTGFELSDLTVGNGTADNFSGSGTTYTADITPTADGEITVDIDADAAIDTAGNGNEAATQFSIDSDRTSPSDGMISINDGESDTNDKDVTLRFYVTGASQMMISENADFSGASYEPFVPLVSKSYTLSEGDGNKTIYVKYKDTAGNETTETISASILLDTTPPTNASILINDGNAFTADKTVALKLSADDAVEMIVSEKSDFSDATYEDYATSKNFTLSETDGTKIIYVKYKDALGNETDAISDRIVLDTTAPTNTSISINKGASVADSRNVTISLSAKDAVEMIISENADFKGATYEDYATTRSFTLSSGDGTKTIYVKFKDALGNETKTISDTIVLDTYVAPSEPEYGTVSGYLTDENGNPIPNVLVELHSDVRQTYTDADGYFEFTDVPAGEHMIYILDDRFESASNLTVAISSTVDGVCTEDTCGGDELDDGLKVEVGESQELTISFVAQADMTDDGIDDSTDDTDVNVPTASDDETGLPTWAFWLIGFGIAGIFFFILWKRRKDDDEEEDETV